MILLVLSWNLIRAQLVQEYCQIKQSQSQYPLTIYISPHVIIIQCQQPNRPFIQIDISSRRVTNITKTTIQMHDQYQTLFERELSNNQQLFIIITPIQGGQKIAIIYLYNDYLIIPQTALGTQGFYQYLKYENRTLQIDSDFLQIQDFRGQQLKKWRSDIGKIVNRSQAEIEFQVYFDQIQIYVDQGTWIFNDVLFSDCQSVLSSINYKLLTYFEFKNINIYLYLRTVSKNIICRMQNQTNINLIIMNVYQQNTMVDYIFDGFNFITIKDCTFEYNIIFLKSNTLLLQNIFLTANSSQVRIQSNFIEILNISCMQTLSSLLIIESLKLKIIITDIFIINTTASGGYLINIPQNLHMTIEIDGIVIINSKLLNFLFFNVQNYQEFTLYIKNVLIVDSSIINDNSTFKHLFISEQLDIQDMKIQNVNMNNLILFQAQVVILINTSFLQVKFITSHIMIQNEYLIPQSVKLIIVNIRLEDCLVSDVHDEINYPILFYLKLSSIKVDYLYLTGNGVQLFYISACLESSFSNIIIYNISNQGHQQQIFCILSEKTSITHFTSNFSKGFFTIVEIITNILVIQNVSVVNFEQEVGLIILQSKIIQIHQLQIISNHTEYMEFKQVALLIESTLIYISDCKVILQLPITLKAKLVQIDNIYLEQIISQKDLSYDWFNIIFTNLTITGSQFNEVLLSRYTCSETMDMCSFNFTNNQVKLTRFFSEYLILQTIKLVNYMYISNNILQSNLSAITFFKIGVSYECQILDNIIVTKGQALQIFNFNNALILIRNLTVKCYDFLIDPQRSLIYISKGQLVISDLLIMTKHQIIIDFTQQSTITLENILVLNSLVNIFMRISTDNDLSLLMRNICSLNQNGSVLNLQKNFNYIEISSLGLSKIEIHNLTIKGFIYSNTVLIYLKGQLQLLINNLSLINNKCAKHCVQLIDIRNSQNINSPIIHNLLVLNNSVMTIFDTLLPAVSFENILIIGAFNSTFLSSLNLEKTQISIKNSEIILNNTRASIKFQFTSNNTRFKELVQIYEEFRVSFDDGKNFAKNIKSDQNSNQFEVIFGNNKNHFYVPSGQHLENFQLLKRRTLSYSQYRVVFFFHFKEESKTSLTRCKLIYQDHQENKIYFQLGHKFNNSIMIVAKPWTQINFTAVCLFVDSKSELHFKAIVMDCQLGEIRLNDICLPCDIQLQLYSVKLHSTQCYPLNEISMKSVYRALIELNPGYWRPHFTNDQIETCTPQQDSCKGGFVFGNQLCKVGYIGAICSECDLFRNQNQQSYTKNLWQICNLCNVTLLQISKQVVSFLMYKYLYIRSAILIFITVISYYQTKKNILITIKFPPFQRIVKWQFDSLGIWVGLLSYYCQSLINVSQNSILSLAPFYVDYDFLTNTSFNFMNLIDCVFASSFHHKYWIYIRILFMLANYCIIFELFVMILLLSLIKNKISYSLILLTIPIINIYNGNILSIFTYLILILLPIEYSGKKYIQAYLSTSDMQLHKIITILFILPITLIIVVVLPIIYLFKIRNNINDNTLRNHFRYFSYLFKKNAYYFELLSKLFSFMIILEIYALKKYLFERLFILIFIVNIQYFVFAYIQPYYSKKLNNWNLTIVLMFDTQLIISGLIDQTSHTLQFILSLIFYLISAYVILYSLVQIILQINDEYYESFDKLRRTIVRYIGDKCLKEHRLFRIRRYYSIIRENIRTRRRRNPVIHQTE